MNGFRHFSSSHPRPHERGLLVAAAMLIAIASFAAGLPAAAQMEYDFNEDGKVTCADFETEYPDTFTDEATKALQQYPDDLRRLNANAEDNAVACEGQPTSAAPAEPSPTPQPPEPAPDAGIPETSSAESVDVPADVMARVAGCAVIAISRRDVVGAGCPGVGTVAFRIPDDAPSMKGTVIMTPKPPPSADAGGTRESTTTTGSSGSTQNDATTENAANAGKDKSRKNQSADSDNSGNDKNTNDKKDRSKKSKKKSGKNKHKKDGKQKRKQ